MRTCLVVVPNELAEHSSEMTLVHHDDVVEALPTECSDQAFRNGVGLRLRDWCQHRANADALRPCDELPPVQAIPVADQEPWRIAPRSRVDQLKLDPRCLRMPCDVHVHHGPATVGDDEEDVERLK